MTEAEKADAWRSLARRAARKFNVGWWIERLTPMLIVLSSASASGLLALRSMKPDWIGAPWIPAAAGGFLFLMLLLISLIAWAMARRRFVGVAEGLVRLEDRLGLENALTTADSGAGAWPEPPAKFSGPAGGWRWKPWRLLMPFLISSGMFALAFFLPVSVALDAAKPPPAEPLAWSRMEEWTARLEEENLVEEKALEEIREKIEELRSQPEEEWFSHGSMEAGDTLRDALSQQIEKLGADLAGAERSLDALQKHASRLSDEGKERLLGEYDRALQGLAMNGLPLDTELGDALRDVDPEALAQGQMSRMTPEQLDRLREALKKGAQTCRACSGGDLPSLAEMDEDALAALLAACQLGGRGGIDRGPGEAPLFFGEEENLKTGRIEGVEGQDYSRAAPGDLLATGKTEHQIDRTETSSVNAGEVQSLGRGGEAIWRESLMPDEKAVLKRFFKTGEQEISP